MPFTNAGASACLNGANGLVGTTRWLALYVGDPTASGVEVSATGYARLQRTTAQMTVTDNAVSFAMAEWDDSADASWGTPDYVALVDADSSGNILAYAEISPVLSEITTGSRVFENAGDITVTIPLS